MILKLPKNLRDFVTEFIQHCPICGTGFIDARIKKKKWRIRTPLATERMTHRTVTKGCRECGLNFNFTWKTFFKALQFTIINTEDSEERERLIKNAQELKEYILKKTAVHRISGEHKIPWA